MIGCQSWRTFIVLSRFERYKFAQRTYICGARVCEIWGESDRSWGSSRSSRFELRSGCSEFSSCGLPIKFLGLRRRPNFSGEENRWVFFAELVESFREEFVFVRRASFDEWLLNCSFLGFLCFHWVVRVVRVDFDQDELNHLWNCLVCAWHKKILYHIRTIYWNWD